MTLNSQTMNQKFTSVEPSNEEEVSRDFDAEVQLIMLIATLPKSPRIGICLIMRPTKRCRENTKILQQIRTKEI